VDRAGPRALRVRARGLLRGFVRLRALVRVRALVPLRTSAVLRTLALLGCLAASVGSVRAQTTDMALGAAAVAPAVRSRYPDHAVRVGGAELHYVEAGKGAPIVLVHGALGDYRIWDEQIAALSRRYRVVAYSRRDHYPNPWPDDGVSYTLAIHAADLAGLIAALRLGPAHVVAHSAGGAIAAEVALEHPELVRSLVLVEPGLTGLVAGEPASVAFNRTAAAARDTFVAAIARGDTGSALRVLLDAVRGPGAYDGLSPALRRVLFDNVGTVFAAARGRIGHVATCDELRGLGVPVLLVGGDRSPALYGAILDAAGRCFGDARRVTVPGASHGLIWERPQDFWRATLGFLDRVRTPR
jgi:non-heme chloroperoxidase